MPITLTYSYQKIASTTISVTGFTGEFSLWAKLVSQDVANNKSKVAYDWDLNISYGWITSDAARDYVSGAGWNESTYREYTSSHATLRHGEETITHNSDGTKSDYGIGRTIMGGMGVDTGDVRGDYVLPTIARASQPSINTWPSNSPNFTLGDTITIHMNRKSSSFTHTVKFKYGNTSVTVGTGITNNVQFDTSTVENAILALIPTSQSYSNVVEVTTYNGTTPIGTKTCAYTATINTAVEHPVVGTITIADTNSRTSEVTQDNSIYIANVSTLQATIPLSAAGTHTVLSEATVTCGSVSQNFVLSGTSQTITFTCEGVNADNLKVTVKDERGTTTTATKTWTLIPYQPVTATATVSRPSATGSVGEGKVTGNAYGGTFGARQNSLIIEVDFKKHDATDYDDEGTQTVTQALTQEGYNSYNVPITFTYELGYQYQYDIKFTVSDLFSTATYVAQLMQGLPVISWDETEVDIWGDLHIHDREDPFKYQNVWGGIDAILENSGNKNLVTMTTPTKTENGVTFTHSGTYYNVNGTATANAFCNATTDVPMVVGQKYILSGLHDEWVEGMQVVVRYVANTDIIATAEEDDVEFTCPAPCYAYLVVKSGTTVSNKRWYPMIRDARVASETYVRGSMGMQNLYWSGTWTNSNSVTRNFRIYGQGLVIAMVSILSDTSDDTGSVGAFVDLRSSSAFIRNLAANANRLTTANTVSIRASATGAYYYDGTSANDRIQVYATCSKNGTNRWWINFVTIGCTVQMI